MKRQNLKKILSALVDDCGYDAVCQALEKLRPLPKPKNAADIVATLDVDDDEKRRALEVLAAEYDAKEFMPSISIVQEFLTRMGRDNSRVKSRQKIAGTVFKCLATWDTVKLQELDRDGWYRRKKIRDIAKAIKSSARR